MHLESLKTTSVGIFNVKKIKPSQSQDNPLVHCQKLHLVNTNLFLSIIMWKMKMHTQTALIPVPGTDGWSLSPIYTQLHFIEEQSVEADCQSCDWATKWSGD